MTELTLYDRVRAWTDNVNITDPKAELACTMEEFGELDEADKFQDRTACADAIGDCAVCLISNDYLLRNKKGPFIEDHVVVKDDSRLLSNMSLLGRVAEGVRKPKKLGEALHYQVVLLERLKHFAAYMGFDFEKDCLGLVVPTIEARVAGGKNVGGSWIKGDDL